MLERMSECIFSSKASTSKAGLGELDWAFPLSSSSG